MLAEDRILHSLFSMFSFSFILFSGPFSRPKAKIIFSRHLDLTLIDSFHSLYYLGCSVGYYRCGIFLQFFGLTVCLSFAWWLCFCLCFMLILLAYLCLRSVPIRSYYPSLAVLNLILWYFLLFAVIILWRKQNKENVIVRRIYCSKVELNINILT